MSAIVRILDMGFEAARSTRLQRMLFGTFVTVVTSWPGPNVRCQSRPLVGVGCTPLLDCGPRCPKCQIASARLPKYQKLTASTAKNAALWIESQKYSKNRV